jgi:cystathionine beta-lyase/cystathionine gamma-synthase
VCSDGVDHGGERRVWLAARARRDVQAAGQPRLVDRLGRQGGVGSIAELGHERDADTARGERSGSGEVAREGHRIGLEARGGARAPDDFALERLTAALEGAEAALCANSGMTAIAACLRQLLRPGERVVAGRDLFGPTYEVLTIDLARWVVACDLVDATDLDAVDRALAGQDVAVLFAETISNPRLRVVDVAALARLAHEHGALLVIDNTFASPAICRPLELGADLVVESLTKYVAGHYDCRVGVVAGSAELVEPIRPEMLRTGQLPSPFEAWLCVRGAQTFPLRVEAASQSAARLAKWLEQEPAVEAVLYPGLASHPDHAVASRTLETGFGGVLSFELRGGRRAVEQLVDELRLIGLASSLGGVATIVNHPTSTTHSDLSDDEKRSMGIHDGLVRLAVGIERTDDLVVDLERGLRPLGRRRRPLLPRSLGSHLPGDPGSARP